MSGGNQYNLFTFVIQAVLLFGASVSHSKLSKQSVHRFTKLIRISRYLVCFYAY